MAIRESFEKRALYDGERCEGTTSQDELACPFTSMSPAMLFPRKKTYPVEITKHFRTCIQNSQIPILMSSAPIFHLRPGIECCYVFDGSGASVRFHATEIHVELSHVQAEVMASAGSSVSGSSASGSWLQDRGLQDGRLQDHLLQIDIVQKSVSQHVV
jgi:hypothetical protein